MYYGFQERKVKLLNYFMRGYSAITVSNLGTSQSESHISEARSLSIPLDKSETSTSQLLRLACIDICSFGVNGEA